MNVKLKRVRETMVTVEKQ